MNKTIKSYVARICFGSMILTILGAAVPHSYSNDNTTFVKMPGIQDARIRRVSVSRTNPDVMAVASDNALYLTQDGGTTFYKAAVLKDEKISDVYIDETQNSTVFFAGSRNAYKASGSIEMLFSAGEGEEIHSIVRHGYSLFVGTSKGLYHAAVQVMNWQRVPGLGNETVYSLESCGNDLYAACSGGVYVHRSDGTLKRLFVARGSDSGDGLVPVQVKVDTMTSSRLWLCTSKGVYSSSDYGETWQKFYVNGAGNMNTYCLAQFPLDGNHFYLCGNAGLFKVETESGASRALYSGLPTSNIRWIDISNSGTIYLATDQGLYRQADAHSVPARSRTDLMAILKGEPSIQEVQQAAMRYNSVHPDKTRRWRNRLKYRALFPKLDLDYDKTIGSSFTSSGYYYAEGPNDWGLSLTWDIGNLIWNSYEDDIDNRTKLTTQLRLDILDQVNRLYFERLRLKYEIAAAVPGTDDTTLKELRLYELTATLDGYTGGLYSR